MEPPLLTFTNGAGMILEKTSKREFRLAGSLPEG